MRANVQVYVRERGKLVQRREGHNVWVDLGEEYLAELVSLASYGPDTPERSDRIKYVGFGIGGVGQNRSDLADAAPLSTAYPAGSDPNATTGREYDDDYSINPSITTLERPVRYSGGSTAYPGAGGDVWLSPPPDKVMYVHPSATQLKVIVFASGTAGDIVYAPFDTDGVPLSEAGLFTSAATSPGEPFNTLVAYHSFDTILLTTLVDLEFHWTVSF